MAVSLPSAMLSQLPGERASRNRRLWSITGRMLQVSFFPKMLSPGSRSVRQLLGSLVLAAITPLWGKPMASSGYDYVDMKIGTGVEGHTIISAARPFGLVKPGPDTEMRRNFLGSDYVTGFSQLHMSGTGGNAQSGAIGVMPTTGELKIDPRAYRSRFSPTATQANLDSIQFELEDYGIHAEITASERVGFYRFNYPAGQESRVLVDVSHAFNKFRGGEIRIVDEMTAVGVGKYRGYHGSQFDVAFQVEFDRPFVSAGVWEKDQIMAGQRAATIEGDFGLGAYFNFGPATKEPVLMKVAVSYVDIEGAGRNLRTEIPDWDFEKVKGQAREAWTELLGKVRIQGGTEEQKTAFYTGLYHTMLSPSILSDVDGRYEGFDGEVHTADGFTYYGEFSLWDTYRTVHPLYTIVQPQRQNDMVRSLLKIAEQGGWLPKWAWSEGYTGGMLGDHAVSVIVDSYVKGIRDFDVEVAYAAIRKNGLEKIDGLPWGRRGLHEYKALGFAPEDAGLQDSLVAGVLEYSPGGHPARDTYPKISGSVSTTLEFAYNDFCVAQMAEALGKEEDAAYFRNRTYNYKNVYDAEVGFMRPRNADGSWALVPFVPTILGEHSQFYVEGNAWTYSWMVPHDPQGLINLMGGVENYVTKLDEAFAGYETKESYYDHSNEPAMHYPYMYAFAGQPWKTQERVRTVMETYYGADHEHGLPGDDDVGTMSAWFILSSMGFYPVNPGSDEYVIGSPLFDEIEVDLDRNFYERDKLVITARNNARQHVYVQSVRLNGEKINRPWITHDELVNGGRLEFSMGKKPNREWGSAPDAAPSSMTKGKPRFVYSDLTAPAEAAPGEYVTVTVKVTNEGALGTAHTKLWRHEKSRHYLRGHLVGEDKRVLDPGESAELEFSVPVYLYSWHRFEVGTETATTIVERP